MVRSIRALDPSALGLDRLLKNVVSAGKTRRNPIKKEGIRDARDKR
jgi:hypothetical protein